jgi:hypothetical protein
MGGSRLHWINSPENLVLVCGSATSAGHCHQHIERHPDEARERGFRLYDTQSAFATPVKDYAGELWFLYPEGHRSIFEPAADRLSEYEGERSVTR